MHRFSSPCPDRMAFSTAELPQGGSREYPCSSRNRGRAVAGKLVPATQSSRSLERTPCETRHPTSRLQRGRPRRPLELSLALLVATLVVGCDRANPRHPDPPVATGLPENAFETVSKLKLEESDTVINVTLSVSIDRNGRLLLADMGECKVRVYDHEARLLMQFGRKGDGPGEFAAPITPIRLESGDVVVPDMGRGLLTFDSMGTLLDQTRPPLRVLFGVAQVDDTTLLVAGPGTPGTPAADY